MNCPNEQELVAAIVPRIKELNAAGCRVFIEFDNIPQEVYVHGGRLYAKWIDGGPTRLDANFFSKLFASEFGHGYEYTVEDIMNILSVEITVANYKEKITALTSKE